MKRLFTVSAAALVLLVQGCATSPAERTQDLRPTETCYVCKHNNDLACVCIKVKETTPRTELHGRTYYFCSEDCRATFLKNPEKYVPKE